MPKGVRSALDTVSIDENHVNIRYVGYRTSMIDGPEYQYVRKASISYLEVYKVQNRSTTTITLRGGLTVLLEEQETLLMGLERMSAEITSSILGY